MYSSWFCCRKSIFFSYMHMFDVFFFKFMLCIQVASIVGPANLLCCSSWFLPALAPPRVVYARLPRVCLRLLLACVLWASPSDLFPLFGATIWLPAIETYDCILFGLLACLPCYIFVCHIFSSHRRGFSSCFFPY